MKQNAELKPRFERTASAKRTGGTKLLNAKRREPLNWSMEDMADYLWEELDSQRERLHQKLAEDFEEFGGYFTFAFWFKTLSTGGSEGAIANLITVFHTRHERNLISLLDDVNGRLNGAWPGGYVGAGLDYATQGFCLRLTHSNPRNAP